MDLYVAGDELLRPVFAYDVATWSSIDPASLLHTSCVIPGIEPDPARDQAVFEAEYLRQDVNRFAVLAAESRPAGTLVEATGGELERSWRYVNVLAPFGIIDELRLACVDDAGSCWAALTMYRLQGRKPFDAADVERVLRLGPTLAASVRRTLVAQAVNRPEVVDDPPGMLLLAGGKVVATTEVAERWLDRLGDERLVSVVRSVAVRGTEELASVEVAASDGSWLGLHAAPLKGADGEVAVVVERLRPARLAAVIVDALGLTPRERDVVEGVLAGRSTQQLASKLEISPWTVQDHLRSVFDKARVRSRGELAALLLNEHYEPRVQQGVSPGPYGWFLERTDRP